MGNLRNLKKGMFNPKLIEGDDQVRASKCMQQIHNILDQYDCAMIPEFIISGKEILSGIKIVAKPRVIPK